jgi:hypothetical protein
LPGGKTKDEVEKKRWERTYDHRRSDHKIDNEQAYGDGDRATDPKIDVCKPLDDIGREWNERKRKDIHGKFRLPIYDEDGEKNQ